jgi:hypothetical protein
MIVKKEYASKCGGSVIMENQVDYNKKGANNKSTQSISNSKKYT